MNFRKLIIGLALTSAILLTGCEDDAYVGSQNLTKAADNFEIFRRIVFYNGITGEYMLSIEGYCSQRHSTSKLEVICKDNGLLKKHLLGLSDNVTYFSEQLQPSNASTSHYRVTFKPSTIIPNIDIR